MNEELRPMPLLPSVLGVVGLLAALAAPVAAQGDIDAIWKDPTFKRQFVAGYGINAEIEPRVSPEEVAILEKILPLMTDPPKAEATLKSQMKPNCSAVLDFTLAGTQFQQDEFEEALANYQKAVTKFPSFRRAWRNLGLIHARAGRYDEAIRSFTRMIELGGGDAYSYGLLGYAYAAKEDFQPSEAAYRNALLLQPDNTEWRLGLTHAVMKQQKFEDAATLLDALITRYPDKADFWLLQARAYLGMDQRLRAAENLEIVDRLGSASADSLNTLGDVYVNENLMSLAADAYLRALDKDPAQPFARVLRAAELLLGRGAIAEARRLTARLHETAEQRLDETDRRKLLKLEARVGMAEGDGSAETAAVLEEIVSLDPLDGEALLLLGQHHARRGERDRALLHYERAARLEAFEVQAEIRQAETLVAMGRHEDAIPHLRRAQEIKPRDDVARYLEAVERFAKSRR